MAKSNPLYQEFVVETKEHLVTCSEILLSLERPMPPAQVRQRIDELFRTIHTIKGSAGFAGCVVIEQLAHALETLLDRCRTNSSEVLPAGVIDATLAGLDRVQALMDDIENSNNANIGPLVDRLQALSQSPLVWESPTTIEANLTLLTARPPGQPFLYRVRIDLVQTMRTAQLPPLEVIHQFQTVGTLLAARLDPPEGSLGSPLSLKSLWYQASVSSQLSPESFAAELGLPGALITTVEMPSPPVAATPPVVASPPAATSPPAPARPIAEPPPSEPAEREKSSSIRLSVHLVDQLMNLAGELVLVRNQLLCAVDVNDPSLRPIVQRFDGVTSELQEAVMRTRMQPVGNLFGKFPRMVRDVARQLNKQIELEVAGTEVELDKTILEALSDPLTHLVRNSCDHGIEPPEVRLAAGKPPRGTVYLSARHLGGQIHITVRDDGKGIDLSAVRRKAIAQGLKSEAELNRMSEKDIYGLILLPGFSTAVAVTDISGRGVGMDVVKTNLDRLGGELEIASAPGRGTTFTLRLPLTLAIIPCLMVVSGSGRYALPQKDLEELVCLQPNQAAGRIEYAFDQEVVRLRDRLLPLVRLNEVLSRRTPFTPAVRAEITASYRRPPSRPIFFAVVKANMERFGLIVDEILNTEEIVVKPMHSALKLLACFAGSTIMGDGRVSLILSTEGIARHSGVRFDITPDKAKKSQPEELAEMQTVLLFRYGPQEQFAVPLAMIKRLERISMNKVERVGDQEFITLGGVSTYIVRLNDCLSVSQPQPRQDMLLLLPKHVRRPMGILLSEIVDTETVSLNLNSESVKSAALVGTAVVRDHMTLFLDVYKLVDLVNGSPPEESKPLALTSSRKRALVVDDTQFFRYLVKGYLEGWDFEVTTAIHGEDALAQLAERPVDLIVSDIEMPVMDGWRFAQAVRARPQSAKVPMVALTTLNSEEDRQRAAECGFDRYEVKIDRDRFLATIQGLLKEKGVRV